MTAIERLWKPVDAASATTFRVTFGLLMFVAVVRFLAHGWVEAYYLRPTFFFTYEGFEWIHPWPRTGMYLHFIAMGVLALLVAAGVFYRFSVLLFGALFAYAHLIDKTNYLNHYYLLICLSFLMAWLPLQRGATRIPTWALWALRAQVGLVYVFGGIAKLKSDWLLRAQPMQIWLSANSDFPLLGPLFDQRWMAYAMSYAGAAFDLSIVPLLCWKRTRPLAYAAVLLFHVITAGLFQLGMFPWVMIALTPIFFEPQWPRRFWRGERGEGLPQAPQVLSASAVALFIGIQALVPLRHHLSEGNLFWTERGYRFSWNVMLMEKNGTTEFRVLDPDTRRQWVVTPTEHLTRYQAKMMSAQPDMVLAFARFLAEEFRKKGVASPQVRVDAFASLNGRRMARLIDPDLDLAQPLTGVSATSWILPLPPEAAPRAPHAR